MFLGTRKRFKLVVDRGAPRGARVFAGLELFCFYASWASLVALFVCAICGRFGVVLSDGLNATLRVALAAAVGFLTNWLAIEMLFKPYERVEWLVPWRQGLVPRNRDRIAQKAAEKITTDLVKPEDLSERIVAVADAYLRRDDAKKQLVERAIGLIQKYRDDITAKIAPIIEAKILEFVQRNATPEKLNEFWDVQIARRLNDPDVQDFLARQITDGFKNSTPQLTSELKVMLADYIRRYIEDRTPIALLADQIANGIVRFIDWNGVEKAIYRRLDSPQAEELIKSAALQMADRFRAWLKSDESREKVEAFLAGARARLEEYVRSYLAQDLPQTLRDLMDSQLVWNWVETTFLPNAQEYVAAFIREKTPQFIEDIDIRGIVVQSIERQNMKDFHQMVNDVTAEHLGAIQVLGYFLGGLVGLLQLLTRF